MLDEFRQQIDVIDQHIIELLNLRAELALAVGQQKKALGKQQLKDQQREQQVLTSICRMNHGPLSDEAIRRLYSLIMAECLRLQAEDG